MKLEAKIMSNERQEQYKLVLQSAEKDIRHYIEMLYQIEQYVKYKNVLEQSLIKKMEANDFKVLGKVALEPIKDFQAIQVGELLDLFNDERIAKAVSVRVDLEQTELNLKSKFNFTDVAIEPIINILKTRLEIISDTLVVKK